jgi:hypothetical protein
LGLFLVDWCAAGAIRKDRFEESFMILIQFPDRETEIKGLAFLLGRFSGKVLRGGLHIVPEGALAALATQNISYVVKGKATYEQEMAALRGDAASAVQ